MATELMYIKMMMKTINIFSPKLAGSIGFRLFQKVRKKNIRDREKPFFGDAYKLKIPYVNGEVHCYIMGPIKGPTVFMMHGWESNAGSLKMIADKLIKSGHQIVAINLPGHAFSKKSWTNIKDCQEAVIATLRFINPQTPISFVSHSFGSAVVTYALSEIDLKVNKLVFITSPNKIYNFFVHFSELLGLSSKAFKYLTQKADKILGEPMKDIIVEDRLTKIRFEHLYLIHDPKDKIIPYSYSESIHSKVHNSSLHPLEDAGHYRILWRDEVVDKIDQCLAF